jgi:signal transduction histidine kinase
MKNPLTPLRLAAHRLERGLNGAPPLREALSVIHEETDRLETLAQAFAQLGRPASGPESEVDLGELMRGLLQTDVPQQIRTRLSIEAGTSTVTGNYDALQRAFRNVIRNAVEAVASGPGTTTGEVDVRVRNVAEDRVEVTVADNGPGIPAGYEEVIFEPDRTLKAKGTGLGLAIVRQVTASHGGTVTARNRDGGGAEFVVELPIRKQRAPAQKPRG